jgi:hypothetical protein
VTAFILSVLLALQGIPIQAQLSGTVSGVLKDQTGKPLAGVRMAAVTKPDSPAEALSSAAMASIAETNAEGRYVLENIPPGRYYIAAGRVDFQTFFPGTPEMTAAKDVSVTSGAKISGIDFALDDNSAGRANAGNASGRAATVDIPFLVIVDGGGPTPVSGGGQITTLLLTNTAGGCCTPTPLSIGRTTVSSTQTGTYKVTIENLPENYVVKSMTSGPTNLLVDTLKVLPQNFQGVTTMIFQSSIAGSIVQQVNYSLSLFSPLPTDPAAQQAYLAGVAAAQGRQQQQPYVPISPIRITLSRVTPKTTNGVRVSGTLNSPGTRTVYASGISGATYEDGTFEILGVPPGRHVIATRYNPPRTNPLGTSVVVEYRDLSGIVIDETTLLPGLSWEPTAALPVKNHAEGVVPLANVAGTLAEEESKQPIREGTIIIRSTNDYYAGSVNVDTEGRFEIPKVLPGTYDLEVHVFGHSTTKRRLEIDDENLKVNLTARRLY